MKITEWLYFGCWQQSGHYVFKKCMRSADSSIARKLERFDGVLPPQDSYARYIATVSRLGGYGATALAFWDYTVDSRPRSNSVFFAPSINIGVDDLLSGAKENFPHVWARLPAITVLP